MRRLFPRGGAALALVATTGPAMGQLLQDPQTAVVPPAPPISTARSVFARDGETAVADRMLPAFSATGTTAGPFVLYPALSIGGMYDNNVYANNRDRHGDVAAVIRPEVTARTSEGPYELSFYARGDVRRYAKYTSENTEEVLGGAEGSVAVGPLSSVTAGVSYGSLIDPRYASDSPIDAAKPLEYRALTGYAGATIEGASTRAIVRGDVERLRFSDTPRTGGGTLFTRDRDRTRYGGLVRLERAISPSLSFYGAVSGNIVDYRLPLAGLGSRDSKGYGLYLGSSFEATRLVRGDVRLGYVRQSFDLGQFRPISGFGALGTVQVFPNRLWTFTATGESTVEDSGVPGTLGDYHRGASVRADHELRRYLILTLAGEYYRDTYRGTDRRDRLPGAEAALTYLSAHHWNARLGYRYRARHCTCSDGVTSFDDHRLTTALTFQY